jgi:hypothetical protein
MNKLDLLGILILLVCFIAYAEWLKGHKPEYTYMLEEDSVNYPVKHCSIRSGIVTYEQNDIRVQKLCAHCVCTRRLKDD